jgi:hypothetical protein
MNENHNDTFPFHTLDVYLDHLKLVSTYCPAFPIFLE